MRFTDWTKVAGKSYFVSNTNGVDSNIGDLTHPFKSIARAISVCQRGDRVYLFRGETWETPQLIWNRASSDPNAPAGIFAYGDTNLPRPVIKTVDDNTIFLPNTGLNIAFVGLDLQSVRTPGGKKEPKGIATNAQMTNLSIEDCKISGYSDGISLILGQAPATTPSTNVIIRGTTIVGTYATASQFSGQGIYTENLDGMLIEDCILFNCGFDKDGLKPSMYRHGMYLSHHGTNNVTVRNTTVGKCAGFGVQLRGSGTIDSCLFVDNGVACSIGGAYGNFLNNLIIGAHECVDGATYQGIAINSCDTILKGNMIADPSNVGMNAKLNPAIEINRRAWTPQNPMVLRMVDNLIFNWPTVAYQLDKDPWDVILMDNNFAIQVNRSLMIMRAKIGKFYSSRFGTDGNSIVDFAGSNVPKTAVQVTNVPTYGGIFQKPDVSTMLNQRNGAWDESLSCGNLLRTLRPSLPVLTDVVTPPVIVTPIVS